MTRLDSPAPPVPEFSRPRRISRLPRLGERLHERATEAECAALAVRYGVPAVRALEVEADIAPEVDGWRVTGAVRARVTRTCVVTLADFEQRLEESFVRRFQPGAPDPELADLDPEEALDPPEPLGVAIDPAEMAAEAIALALDPYPRAPDAVFTGRAAAPKGADPLPEGAARPFAALAALRAKLSGDGG